MTVLKQIQPKLVIVEGIMGAGKSSTSKYIETYLQQQGIKTVFFQEGNLDHPADFEYVACLNEEQFETLLTEFEPYRQPINDIAIRRGTDRLIFYGKEHECRSEDFPEDLYHHIAKYDIYNGLELEKHCELLIERWQHFVNDQRNEDSTVIFECCFLQNPICKLMAQHNVGEKAITTYIQTLAKILHPLNPLLIYLRQSNIADTISRASEDRPKEWLEFVIKYHTEQEYGKAYGLHGLGGFLQFLDVRQKLELELCGNMPLSSLVVDDSEDWAERLNTIGLFLDRSFHFVKAGIEK